MKNENQQIIYKNVSDLIGYINNSRLHSDEQISQVAASIKEFGFTNPILIDGENGIIAGHGRLSAAKMLKLKKVPCIELSHLSEAQKKAYIIADNKLALNSTWDNELLKVELEQLQELNFDLSLIGFDEGELEQLLNPDEVMPENMEEEEETPEPPIEPKTKYGDIYKLGNHRLMCGNSILLSDVNKLMNGSKANMVFTDPPYNIKIANIGTGLKGFDSIKEMGEFKMASGEMTDKEFTQFLQDTFNNLIIHSTNGSIHYICMDWRHMHNVINAANGVFTELKNLCIWNKDNFGMGSFYRSKHELIFVYKNGNEKHINNFELGQFGRTRSNVWDYPIVNSFKNKDRAEEAGMHPTVKPLELVADTILDCSNKNHIVLDLFGGSGTTLIACQKTERKAYIMELDPKYCDVILQRYENLTGQKAELLNE